MNALQWLKVGSMVGLLMLPGVAVAQCNVSIDKITPNSEFTDNGDGTVSHNKTALMWSKCSVGFDVSTCTGTATLVNWRQALGQAEASALAGHSDWRLPSVKEFASLVELSCVNPAINSVLFPSTQSEKYWTSSANTSSQSNAWSTLFSDGGQYSEAKSSEFYIRLVRDDS